MKFASLTKMTIVFSVLLLMVACNQKQNNAPTPPVSSDAKTTKVDDSKKEMMVKVEPQMAQDFKLSGADGKEYSLSDYKGKTVVLEWVNYDCPFVKKHYSVNNMQNLQKKYTEQGVVWLSICSSAPGNQGHFTVEVINQRMKEAKASPTAYLIDESGTVGKLYGAKTTPHMFIINAKGALVYNGAIDSIKSTKSDDIAKADNYVAQALDALLAGKELPVSNNKSYGCGVKYK